MRFRSGEIRVRPDTEWRARVPPRNRALVTALTLAALRRYVR